jgi:hypothetical protein
MGFLTLKIPSLVILVILLGTVAWGSETDSETDSQSARYYVFLGSEKELQINVQIWGQARRPGLYSVPQTTDLVGLISLAGGPTEHANLSGIRVVRTNPKPEVIGVDLKGYLSTGDSRLQPVLKPGDTVVIPGSISYGFERIIRVVSQLAIVANVYYLFFVRE